MNQDDHDIGEGVGSSPGPDIDSGPWSLAGTRSSDNWAEAPGGFDRLNLRAVFQGTGAWDLPVVPAASSIPRRLVPYNSRKACATGKVNQDAVHFFLDDYRFETLWTLPTKPLQRCQEVGLALSPDFSIYPQMPLAMQLWQIYRNRWCQAWMAWHGVEVIPTVTWSDERSYSFSFEGIPRGSVVAISALGIREPAEWELFAGGLRAMLRALAPSTVLCYGNLDKAPVRLDTGLAELVCYPTRWEQRRGRQGQES